MTIWIPDLNDHPGPRYLALADRLETSIASGELQPGERLPTHRALARRLGVTVGTVSRGYAEAEHRGLVSGEVGRGTFVTPTASPVTGDALSGLADLEGEEAPGADDLMDLGPNEPPPLDGDVGARALAATLSELAADPRLAALLGYQPNAGTLRHRAAGAAWIGRTGLLADPARVLVTAGSQHAVAVTLAALARPGDTVLTESLVFPGIKALARLLHLDLEGLPTDADGLVPEAFEAAARSGRARVLYTVPTIQNPTCSVMPAVRRERIAAIARTHGVAIVEDDVHGRLPDDPPPPLASFAPEVSYYVANTSKSLVPGLRIAYLLAPAAAVERLAAGIWTTTWMAPPLMAEIATRWIEDGTAERLLAARRREASERQRLAARVLAGFRFDAHPHGYYLWLHLPEPWRADELVARARGRGIVITPPAAFAVGRGPVPHAVRLCLGAVPDRRRLAAALTALAELLDAPPEPRAGIA